MILGCNTHDTVTNFLQSCLRCKNRKTKCSGEKTCRSCALANAECIYVEKGKRVSILASKLWGMKDRIRFLEKLIEDGKKSAEKYGIDIMTDQASFEYAASPDAPIVNVKEKKESSLESGSSDMLIHKMAEMQHIKLSDKSTDFNKSKLKLPPKRNSSYEDGINNVTLEEAEKLVDFVHFYLSSVNLPFEFEYIVKKLREFHLLGSWIFPDDEYWKPLIYLLLALGQHYQGVRTDIVDNDDSGKTGSNAGLFPFFTAGLSDIFPLNSFQNEKVVVILVLAAYYFRSVNNDLDAILYSSIAMDVSIQLNLHINPSEGIYLDEEVESRSRIFWTAYTTNRFLSAKLGHPISYDTSEITADYPKMLYFEDNECRSIEFPNAEDLKYYIELSKIAEEIVTVIYKKKSNSYPSAGSGKFLESVHMIILKLIQWNESLPSNFRLRLNENNWKNKKENRLKCSIHLNYCYQVHLATVAVLFQLFHEKTTAQQESKEFNLSNLSPDKSTMLTICVNAAQLSTNILVTLLGNSSIAVFGVVDIDYVYSAALTFSLVNFLGTSEVNDIQKPFNSCLSILRQLSEKGNQNATDKYQKIKLLVDGLDKKNRQNSKTTFKKKKLQESLKSLQSPPEHMLRDKYKSTSMEITDPYGSIETEPQENDNSPFPSQILDTSFLPASYEEFVDGESNFLNGENGEFWELAYSNVHLWTSMNQWD